jgi:hypothetical protein
MSLLSRMEDHSHWLSGQKFLLVLQNVPVHSCAQLSSLGSTFIPDVSGGRALLDVAKPPGRNFG